MFTSQITRDPPGIKLILTLDILPAPVSIMAAPQAAGSATLTPPISCLEVHAGFLKECRQYRYKICGSFLKGSLEIFDFLWMVS